jgi:enamine deaminase RidA (YjgF/YER057c/UK114 family)
MPRQTVSSGSPLEPIIGFSRAVRIENHIAVAGTAPIGAGGGTDGPGDAYRQAQRCLEIIAQALSEAGASLDDVIRTRIFLVNMADWEHVARAHGECFAASRPASTFMEVSRFIDPEWLVEIEADAVVER